ncbi:hypothetical protein FPV67DRAFT_1681827 [Lyophyllum atratum]|nr:hypothetical protein FPV67DRAFT_1681827 [Lyophyllum atratum]
MDVDERVAFETLRAVPFYEEQPMTGVEDGVDVNDFLDGALPFAISNAGGEFEQFFNKIAQKTRRVDPRTRRDRILRRTEGFEQQMPDMLAAYLAWDFSLKDKGLDMNYVPLASDVVEGSRKIQVVDGWSTYSVDAELAKGDRGVAAALIRQGLMPCSPFAPHLAFTSRVLELYRHQHLRCPHLAIQPFVKGLCDLHGVPFRPYLSQQFSITYDLYLDLRNRTRQSVLAELGRDEPLWRVRNSCPACTYTLVGEAALLFKILATFDGNDSLKRVLLREAPPEPTGEEPETDTPAVAASKELPDFRKADGDYIVTRERVDRWAKEIVQGLLPADDPDEEESPCSPRWSNMSDAITARMWGIFDETGIFLALCRHGFVLVLADMVRSGELSKYPLAVLEVLLDAFGDGIGIGYDIGCKLKITLKNSPLGRRAQELNCTCLIGAFHGHAHNRLCQLNFLATYVKGMGLEDLEGCERFFSKSNALASSLRYASVFHRQQKIVEFIKHTDTFDTYPSLSEFLVNNYKQALDILKGIPALKKTMHDQDIPDPAIFPQWLEEERTYLKALSKEPLEETLEMEYYQKLVNVRASKIKLDAAQQEWNVITPGSLATTPGVRARPDLTQSIETKRRHAVDNYERDVATVQALEVKLSIAVAWTPECVEWARAADLVGKRRYQRCLDQLEMLIVSRMFELTKMNMSQTGYKLRKHIAQALSSRSQAIRTALDKYNEAAFTVTPPRPQLTWESVVEYAFLADFDLLRDSRQDIRDRPWSRPASRLAMDRYFKTERAREEIQRLDVEIPRVITYIRDEALYLRRREEEVARTNPGLAHQIAIYRMERGRYDEAHMRRFRKLAQLSGFTGSISPGVSIHATAFEPGNALPDDHREGDDNAGGDDGDDDSGGSGRAGGAEAAEGGEGDDDDDAQLAELAFNVLCIVSQ